MINNKRLYILINKSYSHTFITDTILLRARRVYEKRSAQTNSIKIFLFFFFSKYIYLHFSIMYYCISFLTFLIWSSYCTVQYNRSSVCIFLFFTDLIFFFLKIYTRIRLRSDIVLQWVLFIKLRFTMLWRYKLYPTFL